MASVGCAVSKLNPVMTLLPLLAADAEQAHAIHTTVQYKPWSRKTFEDCLTQPYEGWMLKQDRSVTGFCILLYVLDEVTLMEIAVAPEQQGKGLGNEMLAFVLSHCKAKGMHSCWLEVRASNVPAIHLYTKQGFEIVETRKGYYPTALGREDAIVMVKRFFELP